MRLLSTKTMSNEIVNHKNYEKIILLSTRTKPNEIANHKNNDK